MSATISRTQFGAFERFGFRTSTAEIVIHSVPRAHSLDTRVAGFINVGYVFVVWRVRENRQMTKDSKETQHEKFQRVARELQTDESEEAFDRALKKIAKAPKPKPDEAASNKK